VEILCRVHGLIECSFGTLGAALLQSRRHILTPGHLLSELCLQAKCACQCYSALRDHNHELIAIHPALSLAPALTPKVWVRIAVPTYALAASGEGSFMVVYGLHPLDNIEGLLNAACHVGQEAICCRS